MPLSLTSSVNEPLSLPAKAAAQTALRGAAIGPGSAAARRVVDASGAGDGAGRSQRQREDARSNRPEPRAARERTIPLQSGSALALVLAEEQNLSRRQSLALGSYLQTQALAPRLQNTGSELIVGVDTFV
ncbi:MAG: hypothetical protein WBN40_05205 [Pseudomonadales bacterium]